MRGGFIRGSVKNHLLLVTEVQEGQHTGTWVSLEDRRRASALRLSRGAHDSAPYTNSLTAIYSHTPLHMRSLIYLHIAHRSLRKAPSYVSAVHERVRVCALCNIIDISVILGCSTRNKVQCLYNYFFVFSMSRFIVYL